MTIADGCGRPQSAGATAASGWILWTQGRERAVRKRYRTILTAGGKALPEIPLRPKGKRGRIARSGAHTLHERLVKHEKTVPGCMGNPCVSFKDNTGEQKIRMAKVKIKASECLRSRPFATAPHRISSCLSSMAVRAGNAAEMTKMHRAQPNPNQWVSSYRPIQYTQTRR